MAVRHAPGDPAAIAARLAEVRARVEEASARAGRRPGEVTLIAVSKTRPAEDIRAAWEAGQRDFGENYPQELRDKAAALADLSDLRLHLIGTLQANKAKYAAKAAVAFHCLDDLAVAEELDRRAAAAGRRIRCLVEVSLSPEAGKGGVQPGAVAELVRACGSLGALSVTGLMCIPPPSEEADGSRRWFRELRELRDQLAPGCPGLVSLSMGMSQDYEVAIAEGATHVRVGTAIFGDR